MGIVYQHEAIESLRRELCGFEPAFEVEQAVPESWNYARFLRKLIEHQDEADRMLDRLVELMGEELPGFGSLLASDSKAIPTHARPRGKGRWKGLEPDGRRDTDADFGKKTDRGRREDGTLWETIKTWFGYKLHLVVDAEYELPVAYEVTAASRPDNESLKRMVDDMADTHPELLKEAEALAAGRATATPRSSRSSGTATG